MWDDFWESIMPESANLTRSVWNSHGFLQETDLFNLWRCLGTYDRLVTQSLVWVTGEGLNSGGCLLFGLERSRGGGFSGWMWPAEASRGTRKEKDNQKFFSITLGKHVHTPLSATRSGHTVWCYSKFRRSTWLMIRNKGFCSFGLHPQHPPPHTHQQQTLLPSVFPPDSTTYISHEESEVY